jgi:hypothetical protein
MISISLNEIDKITNNVYLNEGSILNYRESEELKSSYENSKEVQEFVQLSKKVIFTPKSVTLQDKKQIDKLYNTADVREYIHICVNKTPFKIIKSFGTFAGTALASTLGLGTALSLTTAITTSKLQLLLAIVVFISMSLGLLVVLPIYMGKYLILKRQLSKILTAGPSSNT